MCPSKLNYIMNFPSNRPNKNLPLWNRKAYIGYIMVSPAPKTFRGYNMLKKGNPIR